MITVIDSTALAMLLNPETPPPLDPTTGKTTTEAKARIEQLCRQMEENGDVLIIPTPVLAEVLVRAGQEGAQMLEILQRQAFVRVKPFDQAAAIEYAIMTQEALAKGHKGGGHAQPWQRVKFDRQIISIARVCGADQIYSDDGDLINFAGVAGLNSFSTWSLPIPEVAVDLFSRVAVQEDGAGSDSQSSPIGSAGKRKINLDDD